MGHMPKGHITISPDDKKGREHTATTRISADKGEIVVEFQATVMVEISAYQDLVKDNFGCFWMTKKPWDDLREETNKRNEERVKRQEDQQVQRAKALSEKKQD